MDRVQVRRGCVFILVSLLFVPAVVGWTVFENSRLIDGPYVSNIVYKVITQDDQQMLALQNNEIDLIGDTIDPAFIPSIGENDFQIANKRRNGYGYLTINCAKYPLNITAFRRAFAFALDKEGICDDVWDGLAYPLDSCVPECNLFSIEGQLPYSYASAQLGLANDLLDNAGFLDVDSDGYREAPDGSDFDVLIESAASSNIAIETCAFALDALLKLGVDARFDPPCFCCGLSRLYYHGYYDIFFLGSTFQDFDVDWLAYEFWSEYADEPFWNFPNFRNDSYDSWREQLLHSISLEEVYEAAAEMQKIWVYECPLVICYQNLLLSAYRHDVFEGHVNDVHQGIPGWWTNFRVHRKLTEGGPYGGAFRWSNPLDVDTFNFMISSSKYTMNVLCELYDSLLVRGPEGENILWLAEAYRAETHEDNPRVPEGHTRFTFNLHQNVSWSDGEPLTAHDVAFSLNYYRDAPRNPYGVDLSEMTGAYAPTQHTVIVEFYTESYWHLHNIAFKPVIPKHVFVEVGLDGWNTWNPQPHEEPMVTSGPFFVSEYVEGEYIKLSRNENYFREGHLLYTPPTVDTTLPQDPPDELWTFPEGLSILDVFVTIPSLSVIAIVLVKWKLETR
jgi:ABC-type transport system substrate-binding protein